METLIGVSSGIIGIILGVVGIAASLNPPRTNSGKKTIIALFVGLSALGVATTIMDRLKTEQDALITSKTLHSLKESSSALTEQNIHLLQNNLILEKKITELANVPYDLALKQTLKRDIIQHLLLVKNFISNENKKFNNEHSQESATDYSRNYSAYRSQLVSNYISSYFPATRELLLRAVSLKLIPERSFEVSGQFILAGIFPPYLDTLQELSVNMAD